MKNIDEADVRKLTLDLLWSIDEIVVKKYKLPRGNSMSAIGDQFADKIHRLIASAMEQHFTSHSINDLPGQ